jgi:hypothetical protein
MPFVMNDAAESPLAKPPRHWKPSTGNEDGKGNLPERTPSERPPVSPAGKVVMDDVRKNTACKLAFTKAEAAQMLGIEETSIDWLLRKGILPHRKVAGKIRFMEIDLRTYLDRVKVDGAVTPCCAADTKGGQV